MTWFGTSLNGKSFQPKQKNRFIVEFGNGGRLMAVKSVSKPTVTVETKEYRMINHYYNYPSLVKWDPIQITFVDLKSWGQQTEPSPGYTRKLQGDASGPDAVLADFKNWVSPT